MISSQKLSAIKLKSMGGQATITLRTEIKFDLHQNSNLIKDKYSYITRFNQKSA